MQSKVCFYYKSPESSWQAQSRVVVLIWAHFMGVRTEYGTPANQLKDSFTHH
jgi:hypothetical protein